MKIRILENSIRLRLTQTEVEQFFIHGLVRQTIKFGTPSSMHLNYSIQKMDIPKIQATYSATEITISVPNQIANAWAKDNTISLQESMPINNEVLKILIEKDFKCLKVREGEDESDMFPNPDEGVLKC